MAQKPCKGDDITLLKRNFWHLHLSSVKTNNIFGILRQNWTSREFFFSRKSWVLKFDLFDLNMTWPWVRCENECHYRILRPKWPIQHMSHDTHVVFLYGDLIWPDVDLYLALASYLHDIFVIPSEAYWWSFRLVVASGLVSATEKAKRVSFDIWPDIDQIFGLAKELWRLH